MGVGWFGDQYDPAEYNMGAAALARMHTVLDSSGTRKKEKKKQSPKLMLPSPVTTNSNHVDINNIHFP